MMKKVVLDCLGGDKGIDAMLAGAVAALDKNKELRMVLVGDENIIKPKTEIFGDRVDILHTMENIPFDEHPTEAIKKRINSSMVLALSQMREREDCGAVLSAGSTGALLTGGFLKIGRIAGVSRPAMCPDLPTAINGKTFMLIDCGANMDCTPVNLVHFAVMANEYKKSMGITNPKIALLNVGTESTKGNEVTKKAFEILTKLKKEKLIDFVGNIEPTHVFSGEIDIVVADGFAGNILLKSIEGTVKFVFKQMKKVMTKGVMAKIGALFLGGKLKKFKNEYMNAESGTIFLGLKKPVIKMHGNCDFDTVTRAIEYASNIMNLDLSEKIEKAVVAAEVFLQENE